MEQAVTFTCFSPHPPIIVPEIGRDRLNEVTQTVEGLRQVMRRLVAAAPDSVVVISPHAPRDPRSFSAYTGPRLRGDFAPFLAPHVEIEFPNDVPLLSRIATLCHDRGLSIWMIPAGRELDHGALVPLYFLREAGWTSSIVVFGLPFEIDIDRHFRFGACIAEAARQLHRKIALIASGDMSHRLTPDAPYEYHPRAHLYDERIVAAVASGAVDDILNIDPALRELAGEDTYQSLLVALGANGKKFHRPQVISYEGPFGVGYLTAILADFTGGETSQPGSGGGETDHEEDVSREVLTLARRAVETFLKEGKYLSPPTPVRGKLAERAGVFVSIKRRNGELRGCVGTVAPTQSTIAEEIIHNAVSAATRDPRFEPVRLDELDDLVFSVDILSPLEPVSGIQDLDPKRYGVMVESDDGRRGLLLPDLAGIDTAEQQVALAMRKANIPPTTPVRYYRFTVERISERHVSERTGNQQATEEQ
ncbi:MAG: AmmeMemoRadiSam system protein A [Acidobacteria bacterium]|nr:MAG: AmmeMemoRadiSam system protein A [Acidobacteriota bacterium]